MAIPTRLFDAVFPGIITPEIEALGASESTRIPERALFVKVLFLIVVLLMLLPTGLVVPTKSPSKLPPEPELPVSVVLLTVPGFPP